MYISLMSFVVRAKYDYLSDMTGPGNFTRDCKPSCGFFYSPFFVLVLSISIRTYFFHFTFIFFLATVND